MGKLRIRKINSYHDLEPWTQVGLMVTYLTSLRPYLSGRSWLVWHLLRSEVPSLQNLMLDDLRWSWCNNNINEVYNRCNLLESSPNHPLALVHGKNCLLQNQLLVPKRLGIAPLEGPPLVHFGCNSPGGKESTGPVNIPTQSPHSLSRAHFLGWVRLPLGAFLRADHCCCIYS